MIRSYLREEVVRIDPQPGNYLEPGIPKRTAKKARINWENKVVRNMEGEEVKSNVNLLMEYDSTLYYDSRFEVNGVEHGILSIARMQDFSNRSMTVYLS